MVEHKVSWNQQEEEHFTKFDELNQLLPSLVPKATTIPITSNPVVRLNIIEDEKNQTEVGNSIVVTDNDIESTVSNEMINVIVKRNIVRQKEPLNIIFCGHVDAGKSTISRQIMFLTGRVDKITLEKYQNQVGEYLCFPRTFAIDMSAEEKRTTYEGYSASFETEKKRCIILDTIGYRYPGPNGLGTTVLADIAILVISARKGEFETSFESGGQTREHVMLVKTAGVRYLVVLINKMDDPTVNWDQGRYDEIRDKLTPYLKKCGFKPGEDTVFMPCSGMSGAFLKEQPSEEIVSWYKGPTFIDYLDSLPSFNRSIDGPLRMPIIERYKEMGVIEMGKIESGCCRVDDKCLIMPNRTRVEVTNIYYEDIETDSCVCGENVRLKLTNVEEEEISPGFILCDAEQEPCGVGRVFDAQINIIEHKSIICAGYTTSLYIHTATVVVQLKKLILLINQKTDGRQERPRFIKQGHTAIARFELCQADQFICMELFKRSPRLGQFILRDEGRRVAIGKVLKIIE